MVVQQNEFEYEFEFYKRSSTFRKKNEFNIPTSDCGVNPLQAVPADAQGVRGSDL